ncbi:MAG: hypothetical protein A2173_08750 [Planctomycetes bacterium RBG_13_44_8b]|nr:MAG: hypothetical protein A2173_08750 [Planctomycetes bacterium RBG_13_44_8b]
MPLLNMPYIEALAVMGKVNPFFEKAGMLKFEAPMPTRCVKLLGVLSAVGIEESSLVDIEKTHSKMTNLTGRAKNFIEKHLRDFLAAYGRRARNMPSGLARTEYLISRLSDRPIYYLWRNPDVELKI